jgi:phenylacetate-coenzyme A ligase PaaK-like adenylate-forming protein
MLALVQQHGRGNLDVRQGFRDSITASYYRYYGKKRPLVIKTQVAHLGHDLKRHVTAHVGTTAEVRVLEPGGIPRSQGKAVRVRDLRPKER